MKDEIKLPTFLFCENRSELPGAGIILNTIRPYYIGKVVRYSGFEIMVDSLTNVDHYAQVPGYNISIQYAGCLLLPDSDVNPFGITGMMERMALFYLAEKITPKKGFYKKYLRI